MTGDQPFMLCQASVAKLFRHSSHRTISNWIRALRTLEVLKLAEAAIPNARAARYYFIESTQL
jgi:Tfp pilus assembly protein PilN